MPYYSDSYLLELISQPKLRERGFRLLVEQFHRPVYGVLHRLLGNHEDVHDAMQNTFVKVYRHIGQFRADSQLLTWVYRIATNEGLSLRQQRQRRNTAAITELYGAEPSDSAEVLFTDAGQMEELLRQAIALLPDKQRLVFELRYYEEMSYEQISELTHTSVGALKASYHHALRKVEEFLSRGV